MLNKMTQFIRKLLGHEDKSEFVHAQKNRYMVEMGNIQIAAREHNKKIEELVAYKIARAAGRMH